MGIFTPSVQPLLSKARRVLRERLQHRPPEDEQSIVRMAGLSGEDAASAQRLLHEMGVLLGVEPAKLRADDCIGSLVGVHRDSLDLDESERELWHRAGFQHRIAPHSYGLLELLLRESTRTGWKKIYAQLEPKPRSDDEWLNVIERMEIVDLLRFLAPALRPR